MLGFYTYDLDFLFFLCFFAASVFDLRSNDLIVSSLLSEVSFDIDFLKQQSLKTCLVRDLPSKPLELTPTIRDC